MKTVKVKLAKNWSHYDAGQIITLEIGKAGRICAKGFGEIVKGKKATAETAKKPTVETAMLEPKGEKAVALPDDAARSKRGPSDEA